VKRFALILLLAAPATALADASKEAPAPVRKLSREWQVDSRLFTADKEAPALRKGAPPSRVAPKLDK
jgi:hypothetical protein